MNQINWVQVIVDIVQAIISGIFVGLVIFWLDERRAKRERRLSDFRIASNWFRTDPKVSLRNFDLTKTNLSGHKFIQANLEDAIISDSGLWATNFSEANLRKTDFQKSRLYGAKFVKAVAIRANFSKAIISTRNDPDFDYLPDFTGATLPKAKFISTQLIGAVMKDANLKSADFSNATVIGCDFSGADLTDSNWKKVKQVENCVWNGVIVDNPENFPEYLWKEIQSQKLSPKTQHKKIRKNTK